MLVFYIGNDKFITFTFAMKKFITDKYSLLYAKKSHSYYYEWDLIIILLLKFYFTITFDVFTVPSE